MAREILEEKSITDLLEMVTRLVKLRQKHIWLDHDSEADVLYVHFEAEARSTHSEMRDDGVILDYRGNRLVGLTVLDASRRTSARTFTQGVPTSAGRGR